MSSKCPKNQMKLKRDVRFKTKIKNTHFNAFFNTLKIGKTIEIFFRKNRKCL